MGAGVKWQFGGYPGQFLLQINLFKGAAGGGGGGRPPGSAPGEWSQLIFEEPEETRIDLD